MYLVLKGGGVGDVWSQLEKMNLKVSVLSPHEELESDFHNCLSLNIFLWPPHIPHQK